MMMTTVDRAAASSADVVLYASEAAVVHGNWAPRPSEGAAGGRSMASLNAGWSTTNAPQSSPANYFELTFDAAPGTSYRVWLRLRAADNSKWNDGVWVQFSDAMTHSAQPVYRIGTTSGLMVNLERCSGCGTSGWGWQNTAYWLSQPTEVQFAASGTHTIRVQTREDGVEVDQIVLSPTNYISTAPGPITDDTTILTLSASLPAAAASPYSGLPIALPGTVQARDFDQGGQNVAYYDATTGNAGGSYRSEDVDLQASADGGHNVGWTAAGEWLKYTVNVAAAETYIVRLRVATPSTGTSVAVAFDKSGVSKSVSVPNTGGWQAWRTVEFVTTLDSGQQVMTLSFPVGAVNLGRIEIAAVFQATPSLSPYSGSPVTLPGIVEAGNFDNGGADTAYHDSTPGNSGGSYRTTDVDLQPASVGGHNVGWIEAGEWLKYTVNVAAAGDYLVHLRVAAISASSIDIKIGRASTSVAVPNTGNWQAWTTVSTRMTLDAGVQVMTLTFPVGGLNLRSITTVAAPVQPEPIDPGSQTGGRMRVMTWNIQQGRTKAGSYRPQDQAAFIAQQKPDVVLLQEINTSTENQPERFKTMLEQLTGEVWFVQWAPIMDSRPTEGNVVLTRLPVASSASHQMHATSDWTAMYSNRSAAQATVLVGGVPIHIFSTHLDYYNTTHRSAQLVDMMAWAETFGAGRIVGGDFNAWWGEWWIKTMMIDYTDTWQDVTGSNQNGYTVNNAVRFDYLFRSKDSGTSVTAVGVSVPMTTLSDHNPVIADYNVTP